MIRLFFHKLRLALQKRTKAGLSGKTYEGWLSKGYQNEPEVSVVIQSHNKSLEICHILPKLRTYPSLEIIVIDDGSDLVHTRRLAEELTGANEFLLRSNDLYENITYDRAIRFANGKYVALLQDDDDFESADWIPRAVALFRQHERLVFLGGKDGLNLVFDETEKKVAGKPIVSGKPFCFVPAVNRAPMWVNKKLFEQKIHHIDFALAPFQYDDYDVCIRAWLSGLQVGCYVAGFKSLSAGGMRLWNQQLALRQMEHNSRFLYEKYRAQKERLRAEVDNANQTSQP